MSKTIEISYRPNQPAITEGSSTGLRGSQTGDLYVQEQLAPAAEDNTNAVIATVQRPVNASTYAGSVTGTLGSVNAGVIKAGAGVVYQAVVTNNTDERLSVKFYNQTTAPTNASTPSPGFVFILPTRTTTTLGADAFGPAGSYFSTGIAWGISSGSTGIGSTGLVTSATGSTCLFRYV